MSIQVTLPSKRVIDVRPLIVDFAQYLEEGETISNALSSVAVFTGIDPTPADLLYLGPEIVNNTVHQRIKAGIPGNIYTVTIQAITSLGHELVADALQAVLPDGVPAEDIYIPLFLTSLVYPLETIEATLDSSLISSATVLLAPQDFITHSAVILAASLSSNLQTYIIPPEGINHSVIIQSAELKEILVSYICPPEGINHNSIILSADLFGGGVIYDNYLPEGINHSVTILSGILS